MIYKTVFLVLLLNGRGFHTLDFPTIFILELLILPHKFFPLLSFPLNGPLLA